VAVQAAAAMAETSPIPAAATPATYYPNIIVNGNSAKCLEIENSSPSNGARAQQWTCVGQAGAYWGLRYLDQTTFNIINLGSNKCLEIENSSSSNGARAQQWDCLGQSGARWRFGTGNNWDLIINASGKCLEIENSSKLNGARAQQWTCLGQPGSSWFLNFIP